MTETDEQASLDPVGMELDEDAGSANNVKQTSTYQEEEDEAANMPDEEYDLGMQTRHCLCLIHRLMASLLTQWTKAWVMEVAMLKSESWTKLIASRRAKMCVSTAC